MLWVALGPAIWGAVALGLLGYFAGHAHRDLDGIAIQHDAPLPVMLHFHVDDPSVHDMSVVDGMNVRLDSRLSAPIGYHGAVFENEAKNFSREGLVTGVGEQRKPGVHYGKLFVPLSEEGENVEGKWFAVDAAVADNSTVDAFDSLKNAVSGVTGEVASPQEALHLAAALIAVAEDIKWE